MTCVCMCAFVCAHPGEDVLARLGGAGERGRRLDGGSHITRFLSLF